VTAYAASKFGLEGWMESLHAEVAPFGITTTVVNPGFFRTELLTEQSTNYAEPSIADYDDRRRDASLPAPMRLPLQSRRSPISKRRSKRTGTSRRRSHSIEGCAATRNHLRHRSPVVFPCHSRRRAAQSKRGQRSSVRIDLVSCVNARLENRA
jgi:NAD(P)-dependent dehydrogenase (short-subunit alcohol dehydrogenase family)